MIRVGFLINYNHFKWLGGFNVITNITNSFRFLKDKKIEPLIIISKDFKKVYKNYEIDKKNIIFTDYFTKQSLLFKLYNKLSIIFLGKSNEYDKFLKNNNISILSHGLHFGLGSKSDVKSISWIPDFQHVYYPENFTFRNRIFKYINTLISAKTSSKIILSSNDAKRDLQKILPIKYEKTIIHPYVFDLPLKKKILSYKQLKKKYKIPKNYFFIPNQFWKHKNHDLIVETLRYLKEKKNNRINIVLTGFPYDHRHENYFEELNQKIDKYQVRNNYIYLGVVPYLDVMSLMFNSIGIINPSKFEGCSSSVEQAKSMGKKVILSNINIHKEQNPSKGYYFHPDNFKQLAKKLIVVLKKHNKKKDLKSINYAYSILNKRLEKYALDYQKQVLKN